MGKTKIRSTINPGEVLNVDDAELLDLERQGLVKAYVAEEEAAKKAAKAEQKEES